ncbi:MAG: MarR family transcriptional regulator [Gammaproteobacteria bacterium]
MTLTRKTLRPIREPVPLAEPGADIGFALRQLMQTLRQTIDLALRTRGIDLSFVHAMVLRTLAKEPGISGAQLARRVTVTAQSMNGLLRGMESLGLVLREPHPENRRTDCWYMTTEGLKQVQQGGEVVDRVMGRIRASVSKADAERLVELLHQCAAALQNDADVKPTRAAKSAVSRATSAG